MARLKTFDPKYAPKNHAAVTAEEGTPRGTKKKAPAGLGDDKLGEARRAVEAQFVSGRLGEDERVYMLAYLWRMRCDWGPWFDATSLAYVLGGGHAEIACHKRAGRWDAVVEGQRKKGDQNAAD